MSSDPNDGSNVPETQQEPTEVASAEIEPVVDPAAEAEPTDSDAAAPGPKPPPRRRILIGSQRDAAAYRPKPQRDSIRIVGMKRPAAPKTDKPPVEAPTDPAPEPPTADVEAETPPQAQPEAHAPAETPTAVEPQAAGPEAVPTDRQVQPAPPAAAQEETVVSRETSTEPPPPTPVDETAELQAAVGDVEADLSALVQPDSDGKRFPLPNIREQLSPDLEEEFQEALADAPLDDLIADGEAITKQPMLEADSRHTGRVVMIRRENAFVELGGREQGILPMKQFDEPPEIGAEVEVRVVRFLRDDGLYELSRAGSAANVADWADLEEGMLVEAKVTGHNTGGLECEVNRIRGFIPVSQISLYRVEDLSEFADEKFTCLVTEANPRRRNLVLSRRAVLEREREEARQILLESLEPGQVHEGVVRKLVDFGAFVDLGGVDGLLHVSQLAWGRVNHPREVLQTGQTIKVKIQSVDKAANRISLAYRDLLENPWTGVEMKYPVTSTIHGQVTKLMEFGAFVELEPGVEGLVHVSELSHKRVWRVSDVVKEGDEIDAVVLSVDAEAQRISLSMKDLLPEPEPAQKEESSEPGEPAPSPKRPQKPAKPLQGGLGRSTGGDKFGLKW